MIKSKKSQGLSITTIIVAAIALIVLVVLVAIFTGRIGIFSSGISGAVTCENSCKAFGMDRETITVQDRETCNLIKGAKYAPGDYGDVTSGVCCCIK